MVAAAALLVASAPARATVLASSGNGFEVESRVDTALPPAALFRAFGDLPSWWSAEHSYSGKSANLSLDLKPGGCWCERLPSGGGVEHMRVAFVDPPSRIVLTGALGPLLAEATTGVMQVVIEPSATGSSLVINYRAAGFAKGGAARLAPAVDQVLAIQAKRLAARAEELARKR
ncbi:SRPBCC family protein [Sphingomonas swuensis]|uniref:SRPBCC family protein n=2 Tax=Sphingomonas swuensis TaxID=977800 RepID=A0ABP7T5V6_9SPHN